MNYYLKRGICGMIRNIPLPVLLTVLLISGCGQKYEEAAVAVFETAEITIETVAETITIDEESGNGSEESENEPEEPEERIEIDGKIRSYLTGEMMPVAQANRRPLAIMMSNDKEALPQYGINRAGIVYEAPVEGEMNRYMALIEDYDDRSQLPK